MTRILTRSRVSTKPRTVHTDGCVQLYNGGSAPVSVIADLSGYQVSEP